MYSVQILIYLFFVAFLIYFIYLIIFIIGFILPRKYLNDLKPKISIIVAARNEEQKIERCVKTLCAQFYPKDLYEVIIVNDNSTDSTKKIVFSLQKKYKNLNLINIEKRPANFAPKKFAITEALNKATGEIVITTDADITVRENWVESIVSYFEKDVGLVVGFSSIRDKEIKRWYHRFEALDFLMLMMATKGSINIGIPISCSGQNLSFRKKAFLEVGGFADQKSHESSDDVLLLHKIHNSKKWKIAFADDYSSFVETDASKSILQFLKQRIRWASMGISQFSQSINLTILSIVTAIVNSGLIVLLYMWVFGLLNLDIFIFAIMIKFCLEFIIALFGSISFKKYNWVWFFPFLFLLYSPYILIISIFSMFGNFKWKERVYKQGNYK